MLSFTNAELRNSLPQSFDGTQDAGDQNTRGSRSSLVDGDWELSEALGISFNDAEVSKVEIVEREQIHWSHVTDSSTTPQPRELSPQTYSEHSKRYSELSTLEQLDDERNHRSECRVVSAENEPDLLQRLNSEIGIDSIIATETTTHKSVKVDELLSGVQQFGQYLNSMRRSRYNRLLLAHEHGN